MPRLLVVSDTLAGGSGAAASGHAEWFARRGWEVELAAPAGDRSVPSDALRPLPMPRTIRDVGGVARAARVLRHIRRRLRPDVIHCHGARALVVARLSGGKSVFVTLHGVHPGPKEHISYSVLRRPGLVLCARLARGAFSVFPDAPAGWTFLPHASPRLKEWSGHLPFVGEHPTFLSLGALESRKRHDRFVDAMALLCRTVPTARGVIAGAGPLRDTLARHISARGAPVELVGHVPDARALIEQAWAVVCTSESEGVPFSLQEAMWLGRGVVSSLLPGAAWLVGTPPVGGRLAGSVPDIAAALGALSDLETAVTCGGAAAERVRTILGPDDPWPTVEGLYLAALGR